MADLNDVQLHPEIDAEALLVSASMFCRESDTIRCIGRYLNHRSFHNRLYGEIFDVIIKLAQQNKPYDAASVRGVFVRDGKGSSVTATSTLTTLATLGASDLHVRHYAMEVSSQAYRRSYHDLASSIEHAAANAPEEKLFEILVSHGRTQRALWTQHQEFCTAMESPIATDTQPPAEEVTDQLQEGRALINIIQLPHLQETSDQSPVSSPAMSTQDLAL